MLEWYPFLKRMVLHSIVGLLKVFENLNYDLGLIQKIKDILILNDHKINSKLTIELIKKGFKVKPFVSQVKVTKKSNAGEVEYNKAAARYGLKIESENKGMTCVFSMNRVDEFVFTLIDLRTNDIVDIFEKKGPTGKCPPLTPIYIIYAEYLASY